MKKKIIINMLVVSVLMSFIGTIFIIVGATENKNYYENSLICEALITDLKTESFAGEWTSYHHRYYGEYTVNKKTYSKIEILKTETDTSKPDYSIGQTIKIRVIKDNPERLAKKGTISYIMGFSSFGCVLLIIVLSLVIYKNIVEPKTENLKTPYESLSEKSKEDINETKKKLKITNSKIRTCFIFSIVGFFFTLIGCFVRIICASNLFLQPFYFVITSLLAGAAIFKAKKSFKKIPDHYEEYYRIQQIKKTASLKLKGIILSNILIYFANFFIIYFLYSSK